MEEDKRDKVQVADQVIAVIAGMAAKEVDGVVLASGFYEELAKRVGGKKTSKGVVVSLDEGATMIEMRVLVRYGTQINRVCQILQEKVKEGVEFMTGLPVREVHVRVDGIEMG